MVWLSYPLVTAIIGCLFVYIILLQMAQFYSQQAYGLWPQVWPVPEEKVIKGYEQFLYRLMFVICTCVCSDIYYKTYDVILCCTHFLYCRFIND